jgi:hypothetical protein
VDLIEFFEVEKREDFVDLEESAKPTRISESPADSRNGPMSSQAANIDLIGGFPGRQSLIYCTAYR